MKNIFLLTLLISTIAIKSIGQQTGYFTQNIDSVKHELAVAKSDTSRVLILEIGRAHV